MLVDIDLQCPVLSGVFVILCKCIEYVGDLAVVLPMLFFLCGSVAQFDLYRRSEAMIACLS